jgi:hypothetical protein
MGAQAEGQDGRLWSILTKLHVEGCVRDPALSILVAADAILGCKLMAQTAHERRRLK